MFKAAHTAYSALTGVTDWSGRVLSDEKSLAMERALEDFRFRAVHLTDETRDLMSTADTSDTRLKKWSRVKQCIEAFIACRERYLDACLSGGFLQYKSDVHIEETSRLVADILQDLRKDLPLTDTDCKRLQAPLASILSLAESPTNIVAAFHNSVRGQYVGTDTCCMITSCIKDLQMVALRPVVAAREARHVPPASDLRTLCTDSMVTSIILVAAKSQGDRQQG